MTVSQSGCAPVKSRIPALTHVFRLSLISSHRQHAPLVPDEDPAIDR